jgi:branched-chain amino acid transport system substrate-binding protein
MQQVGRRASRAVRTLGLVVLVAVAVVGTSAASTAATKPTVTIGVLAPVDGGLTDFGRGIRNSVMLAVKQANARNLVKGWNVQVRTADDSSDPATGEASANTLASDSNVVAVVGPYNSGVALKAAPVLAAGDLALVSPGNTLTSLTIGADVANPQRQWDSYFRMVGPDTRQAEFLAAQAKRLGFKTAAVVSETKAVSQGLADEFVGAFKKQGGEVAVQKTVPDNASATDFNEFITAAKSAEPDLVFFGGEYNVAAVLRTTATSAGLTVPMMGGDGVKDNAFISSAGDDAKGTYASSVGVPLREQPGARKFLAAYRAARYDAPPSDFGPYAYDAANVVLGTLAKELNGKTTLPDDIRSKIVSDLQSSKDTGVTGKVAFDKYGDAVAPKFTLYRVAGSPPRWVQQTSS